MKITNSTSLVENNDTIIALVSTAEDQHVCGVHIIESKETSILPISRRRHPARQGEWYPDTRTGRYRDRKRIIQLYL